MELRRKLYTILKWITRILAIAILLFGLPFYFGYGNPLPFINPKYSLWDNTWLSVFPLMFIGLGLGLRFPKAGGFLITIPIMIGFILGYIAEKDITLHMFIPFIVGILYIITGYLKIEK